MPISRTVARLLLVPLAASLFTLAPAPQAAHADQHFEPAPGVAGGATRTAHTNLEDRVLTLTNRQRRAHGCPALRSSVSLRKAARGHSATMARANVMSHQVPGEAWFSKRITRAGYTDWRLVAENIARGFRTPREVVRAWMKSPSHRRNILNCRLRELGVGIVLRNDQWWWTQNFGRR